MNTGGHFNILYLLPYKQGVRGSFPCVSTQENLSNRESLNCRDFHGLFISVITLIVNAR